MDAVLDGSLDAEKLAKLLPAAASAAVVNQYARDLARESEHVLVGEFHRALKRDDCIDSILASLRPKFTEHAEAIEHARDLINPESSVEQILESGTPELVAVWQGLKAHIAAVSAIGDVARQFGPRLGNFPAITEYSLAEGFRVDDRALFCCGGPSLALDSAPFLVPDSPHRGSAWFRVPLKLNTLTQAKERYRRFASEQWERVNSGPVEQWVDEKTGKTAPVRRPTNPYADASVG
jgi:hypothetical protein